MENWQRSLKNGVCDINQIADRFGLSVEKLRQVNEKFPFRTTPYYLSLIESRNDPIYRQCIPDANELEAAPELVDDPLGEEVHSPVPGLVQRYPDRCLFLVSDRCASHCRFCTRKRKFRAACGVPRSRIDAGIAYIVGHSELRDILLSGGDVLMLTDVELEYILRALRAIPHVEIIRIGTRTPCVLPERITAKLCRMLKKYHPVYVNVHFNHPRELTTRAVAALERLADAGIPLGNQSVLLRGVNDTPEIMLELVRRLLAARVKPYYIHQMDLISGAEHFRTPLASGLAIMDALRGWTSGLAVPYYVIDLPGGGGKVPLLPQYLQNQNGNILTFRNFRGTLCDYPDI